VGGLGFVTKGDDIYVVFGGRHKREVGGEIDMPPAGFLKPEDLWYDAPCNQGIIREAKEEVAEPKEIYRSGVIVSDFWRNLTACYDVYIKWGNIEKKFELKDDGELVVLKRKKPKPGKYGEDGLFLCYSGHLKDYVEENADRFGERAALLLRKYLESNT